jgi:hypothetical protein
MIKYILIIIGLIILVGIWFYTLQKCEPNPPVTTVKVDTLWKIIPREPVNIDSIKATVKPRKQAVYVGVPEYITITDTTHDTIKYTSSAYSACFDTIINRDTMGIEFDHPECVFRNFYHYPHPDSVREITKTITIYIPPTFWEKSEYVGGGILGGFILGWVSKK